MSKVMTKPVCRSCHAPEDKQTVKGDHVYGGTNEQHFWKCSECDIIYLNPPMSEEEEERFYNQEFEKYMGNRAGVDMDWSEPEAHFQSNQREVARRMPFLEKFVKAGHQVLEIGCSSGFMLSALKEKGADVLGLDPSGGFINFVQSKGIDVFQSLEDLKMNVKSKFDLIIHYYVLEHIRQPIDFIRQYMDLISPGGTMVFEVPCSSDPLIELYKIEAFDKFYWSVAHHWYFNKKSLSKALTETEYEFELYPEQRYDISNHMTWMLDGRPGGFGRFSEIFGQELDQKYKDALRKHWLCDTIIAVVKK